MTNMYPEQAIDGGLAYNNERSVRINKSTLTLPCTENMPDTLRDVRHEITNFDTKKSIIMQK